MQNFYKIEESKQRDFLLKGVFNLGKVEEQIVVVLKNSESPLTLAEIAEKLGKPPKSIFRSLRKLFEEGKVDCNIESRRYTLAKE